MLALRIKKTIMKRFSFCLLILISLIQSIAAQDIKERHQAFLTLDSHTDTPLVLSHDSFDFGARNDYETDGSRLDLIRMDEGGLDAVFFAVFVGQGDRSAQGHLKARERAERIFTVIDTTIAKFPDRAALAYSVADARRNIIVGRKSIFVGIENGYPIGTDLKLAEYFYNKGARYITLCHSKNNEICDSSTDQPEHDGLSDFGDLLVREMNRLGMMVDVSHISDKAFFDVLSVSDVPVIASHSNARALCNNPRNLTDSMLVALKENGGVAQVCVLSAYVKAQEPNPEKEAARDLLRVKYNHFENLSEQQMKEASAAWREIDKKYPGKLASVSDLVDHIDHIVRLIGIDHVGFGSDFDGGGDLSGCRDVSQLENITAEMIRRGYSDQDLQKFWSGNFLRVFSEVEKRRQN